MFEVDWTQHAVGHGGFHTGRARAGDSIFSWMFDCGSRSANSFDALLTRWTTRNRHPVDWLFVSHFDTDHVSGLDTLMTRAVVRDVMVPYVNEHELAIQLLHEINRGNLNRAFYELIADPAAFFLRRGAERVTFLTGDGGGTEGAEPDFVRPRTPSDEKSWVCKIDRPQEPLLAPRAFREGPGEAPRVLLIDGPCQMTIAHGAAVLRLKPYRAPIAKLAHKKLMSALKSLVGAPQLRLPRPGLGKLGIAIGHHARTRVGRAELRAIYKLYAGSSNRSSCRC